MAANPTFASLPSAPSGANAKLPLALTSEFNAYCSTANAGRSGADPPVRSISGAPDTSTTGDTPRMHQRPRLRACAASPCPRRKLIRELVAENRKYGNNFRQLWRKPCLLYPGADVRGRVWNICQVPKADIGRHAMNCHAIALRPHPYEFHLYFDS